MRRLVVVLTVILLTAGSALAADWRDETRSIVFFADVADEFGLYVGVLFLLLPLPGLWVLLFWDVISVAGLWTYAAAYLVVPWAAVFVPDIIYYKFKDHADRRTALSGRRGMAHRLG